MQNLEPILIFIRVAEMGSFTHAADSLGIRKGRASTAVRKLEDDVGVRLLHRTTRSVAIDRGRTSLPCARPRSAGRRRRPAFDVCGRSRCAAWTSSGRPADRTGAHDDPAGLAEVHDRESRVGVGSIEHGSAGRSGAGGVRLRSADRADRRRDTDCPPLGASCAW